jgi:hypothetical protein
MVFNLFRKKEPRITQIILRGKVFFFKVLISAYEKRSEAQQMANTIRSKEKIQGFVVKE